MQERRSLRVTIGLAAVLALAASLVAPLATPRTRALPPAAVQAPAALAEHDERVRTEALSAATSLASSLAELARARALHEQGGKRTFAPPPASAFPSETACLASFLPKLGPVDPESLDFICEKSDVWSIERQSHVLMTGKPGQAAQLWKRLGPYSLAALAMMRGGCCVDREPLAAVVPGLWCGVLRDKLSSFTPLPERSTVQDYERSVSCLVRRGARLPAHWATVPAGRGRRAFDEFLEIARSRR